MMNSTNLACNDDMTGYGLAGGIALLTIISEILPLVKKIPYNGLLHIFTSQCFKKKKEPKSKTKKSEQQALPSA